MGAKGKPKTGGRKPGTPNKATLLKPYKAALEEVIQEHPELLKQIAHAQLKAAAGKGPEGYASTPAAKEIADRLDGKVVTDVNANVDSNATIIVRFPGLDE
jgi:hypothetical protein